MLASTSNSKHKNSRFIAVLLYLISLTPVLSVSDKFAVINVHKHEFSSGQPQMSGKSDDYVNFGSSSNDGNLLLQHIQGRFANVGRTIKTNGRLHMVIISFIASWLLVHVTWSKILFYSITSNNIANNSDISWNSLYPCSPKGEGGILFYLCPSVQDIFRCIFLSNCWWQKFDIWSQASYRCTILWVAFLDWSDSYFLFADLVGFYTHWIYMHIFRHIFLSNYWWQESDIWSQASYRYAILWEAFLDPSDSTSCLPT